MVKIEFRWILVQLVGLATLCAMQIRAESLPQSSLAAPVEQTNNLSHQAGHILVVENVHATSTFTPQRGPVAEMMRAGILSITGKSTVPAAWLSLLTLQDIVGIKVCSAPGRVSGTRPEGCGSPGIPALIEAGIPPGQDSGLGPAPSRSCAPGRFL